MVSAWIPTTAADSCIPQGVAAAAAANNNRGSSPRPPRTFPYPSTTPCRRHRGRSCGRIRHRWSQRPAPQLPGQAPARWCCRPRKDRWPRCLHMHGHGRHGVAAVRHSGRDTLGVGPASCRHQQVRRSGSNTWGSNCPAKSRHAQKHAGISRHVHKHNMLSRLFPPAFHHSMQRSAPRQLLASCLTPAPAAPLFI